MVRVGGMNYVCDPNAKIGARISAMTLNGAAMDADKRYKVAGWAPVAEEAKSAGGAPIWDVVEAYLTSSKTIAPRKLNVPRLVGMSGNPGLA